MDELSSRCCCRCRRRSEERVFPLRRLDKDRTEKDAWQVRTRARRPMVFSRAVCVRLTGVYMRRMHERDKGEAGRRRTAMHLASTSIPLTEFSCLSFLVDNRVW